MPAVEHASGRSELEIELKYFDGEPVIREIARVSKPGRRVYASVKALPRINNGLGVVDSVDAEGRDGGPRRPRRQCRRRNPLHGVLTCLASAKKPVAVPSGVTANVEGQTVKVKGPKGALQVVVPDEVSVEDGQGRDQGRPAQRDQARALDVGHLAHAGGQSGDRRDQGLRARSSRSPASAIVRRCRARTCSCSSATATT